jgi:NAD-dependent dihydropyrimidine dehydrogenase PreA subunit
MSGTGNSLRLAREFASRMAERGGEAWLEQISPKSSPTLKAAWLAVFFPTHGFTTPWPVLRWAWSLPRGHGMRAAVVSSRAGWWMGTCLRGLTGSAPFLPAFLMAIKGYRVRGILSVDMPSNWILVHPGLNAIHAARFLERGRQKISAFSQDLLAGRRCLWSLDNLFEFLSGMVLLPVSAGYLLYGRPLFAKLFFANERCNGCGICATHCREGAIKMKGSTPKPYWTLHCESCMRCMNLCPVRAVEAGQSLGVLLNLAAGLPLIGWLLARMIPQWPWLARLDTGFPRFALNYAWYLLALLIVYFLIFHAMRWRPVRLLFSFTTLTRWFRRYREPTTMPRDLPGAPHRG